MPIPEKARKAELIVTLDFSGYPEKLETFSFEVPISSPCSGRVIRIQPNVIVGQVAGVENTPGLAEGEHKAEC